MSKKIVSLFLAFVMMTGVIMTALPVYAVEPVVFTMYPDKNEVSVGETVTYTITMSAVSNVYNLSFGFILPEGLTLVEDSAVISAEITNHAAVDTAEFFYETCRVDIYADKKVGMFDFNDSVDVLTFTCKVADDASVGSKVIGWDWDEDEFYDEDFENILADVSNTSATSAITVKANPATCVHTGGTATCKVLAVCELCGTSYGDYAEHTGGTATCVAQAVCGVCGTAYGSVNPDNHTTINDVAAKTATCLENGWEAHKKCADCQQLFTGEGTKLDAVPTITGEHNCGTLVPAVAEKHTTTELAPAVAAHYYCAVCGTYFTEGMEATTLAALTGETPEHDYTGAWEKNETKHWKVCTCGLTAEEAGHTYDNDADMLCNACEYDRSCKHDSTRTHHDATAATCAAAGNVEYWECECGAKFDAATAGNMIADVIIPVDSAAHIYGTLVPAVAEKHTTTELAPAVAAHYYCAVCGTYFTEGMEATTLDDLTGETPEHDYTGAWEKNETKHWKVCSCGLTAEEAGHTYDNDADMLCNVCEYDRSCKHDSTRTHHDATAATCAAAGNVEYWECECGAKLDADTAGNVIADVTVPKNPDKHTNIAAVEAKEATDCKTPGWEAHAKCEGCEQLFADTTGKVELEAVPVISGEHSYGELIAAVAEVHTKDELKAAVDAHYYCSVCEGYFTAEKKATTLAALTGETPKHIFSEWVVTKEAGKGIEGEERRDCTVCEAFETREIEALKDDSFLKQWYTAMLALANRTFKIDAEAGFGGEIDPEGILKVKTGKNVTYTITPDEGYEIEAVYVDGKDIGAVEEYTFKNVKKDHTILAEFAEIEDEVIDEAIVDTDELYFDVDADDWFYDDVAFVTENGLMNGMGGGLFVPEAATTRAMIVTVLWRLEGEAEAESAGFTDVAADMWYTEAIDWAAANGIVLGYGDGTFGPENNITREQVMAILNRYAAFKGWDDGIAVTMIPQYNCSVWAENNVNWADMNGILADLGVDVYDMTAETDRAEIAAYFTRFCLNVAE